MAVLAWPNDWCRDKKGTSYEITLYGYVSGFNRNSDGAGNQLCSKGKEGLLYCPNALSFEKERKVLEYLPQSASFEITVTRFTQMARYFILNTSNPKTQLDDTGLAIDFL